jgi:AraC-like DNA-binding protein
MSVRHDANRRLLRARDEMDRSYADALDIEALARSVHLSRAHFIRSFRDTFGETPHRYLQRRRIERAMAFLRETDRPVSEISLDVGFLSLGTFSRTFREIVGVSPSAYRTREQAAPRAATRPGVNVPGRPEREIMLMVPGPPALDPDAAEQVRALLGKGVGGAHIFTTPDCRALHATLVARGVEFTEEPVDRFYGTDCALRDPFGNSLRITQPAEVPAAPPA